MEFDEPPFLVKIGEDQEFKLDESVLNQILDKLKPPFVVLSVIGSPGSGKSFFLNYFLRYLKANGERNWIGEKETPLDGFPWNQRIAGDDEGREGIRIYHEFIGVAQGEGRENSGVRLLLLDIDYYAEQHFETNYAALEAFCLSVSNDVIYIDSNQRNEEIQRIDFYLEQVLTSLIPVSSNTTLKYFSNSAHQMKPESQKISLPRSLKRLKPRKLEDCSYNPDLPRSFKGEMKYLPPTSLRNIRSILVSGFPVSEILANLSSPSKHYASCDDVALKFNTVLNAIKDGTKDLVEVMLNQYYDQESVEPSSDDSDELKLSSSVSITEVNSALNKKVASEVENANNRRYFESADPKTGNKASKKPACDYICDSTKPSIATETPVPPPLHTPVIHAQPTQRPTTKPTPSSEEPAQKSVDNIIKSYFNLEFQKVVMANLKFFVREDTRSKLTRIFKDHFAKVLTEYSGESEKNITEQIEKAGQEYIKSLKPVLTTIEKFVSMMENEFDSELYLDDVRLNTQLNAAHAFALKRFTAGENGFLDWLVKECLQACAQNYQERNSFVCKAESSLMRDVIQKVVNFFKQKLISQVSSDNPDTPEKLQEQKEEMIQNVTTTMNKVSKLNPERTRVQIHEIIDAEFAAIIKLHEESWLKIKKNYDEILSSLLTSYEEQMRPYIEKAKDLKIVESFHSQIKNSVVKHYCEITQTMQHANTFESRLTTAIEKSHSESRRHLEAEIRKTSSMIHKFKIEDESKKAQKVSTETAPLEATIGIHFGRYKIRCTAFKDNKFIQVPLERDSSVLPSYIGIDREDKIVFGELALRRKEYHWHHCLKISDMAIGQIYPLHGRQGKIVNICFEEAVALVLKYIHNFAGKCLKDTIMLSVITVPSLADHTYRKSMLDAAELAGIPNVHLISECSGAISKYCQKFPSHLGSNVSVLVAYHSGKDELEAGYFKVTSSSSIQKSVLDKFYDKPFKPDGGGWGFGWIPSISNLFSTKDNEEFSGIVKNVLDGANTKDLDVIVSVGDGVQGQMLKVKKEKNCSTVDLATGVVEGGSLYANSLTTKCPNHIQDCLPYEIQYEYLEKNCVALNKYTPYPNEASVIVRFSAGQNEVHIKLTAYYSKEFSIHTQTLSVSKIYNSKFDMVEFHLKLDTQGILSISAELVESGDRKKRKTVNVNVLFDRNMDFLNWEKCKANLEEILQFH